jgi:hypothetical protein
MICSKLAKQKSKKTREKVDKAISKFSIEGKVINFNSIAKEANVASPNVQFLLYF